MIPLVLVRAVSRMEGDVSPKLPRRPDSRIRAPSPDYSKPPSGEPPNEFGEQPNAGAGPIKRSNQLSVDEID
jgi:hypothetical protein